jgi:hypothetical protein
MTSDKGGKSERFGRLDMETDSVAYDKMTEEERNEQASKQEFLATWARQVELSFASRILERAREKADSKLKHGKAPELWGALCIADIEAIIKELTE